MGVVGPRVSCHKCGQRLVIDPRGLLPIHDKKGTSVPCVGSLEKPK
jgi:hypothetical protein